MKQTGSLLLLPLPVCHSFFLLQKQGTLALWKWWQARVISLFWFYKNFHKHNYILPFSQMPNQVGFFALLSLRPCCLPTRGGELRSDRIQGWKTTTQHIKQVFLSKFLVCTLKRTSLTLFDHRNIFIQLCSQQSKWIRQAIIRWLLLLEKEWIDFHSHGYCCGVKYGECDF